MIKVLPKAVTILELFSNGGEYSFAQIAEHCALSRSNTSHILDTLCELELLCRPRRGQYQRGARLLRLVGQDDWAELHRIAERCTNTVLEYLDELAVVGLRHDLHRLTLAKHRPRKYQHIAHELDERFPTDWYGTGNGRMLLAFAPDEILVEIVRRRGLPPHAIWPEASTLPKLRRTLARIRKQRFLVMTMLDELKIISVPACDASGQELLSVSTGFPISRQNRSDEAVLERLNFAAEHLTKELKAFGIRTSELKISGGIRPCCNHIHSISENNGSRNL